MADRLTDAPRNKALVERLNKMSLENPDLTLSSAIEQINQDLDNQQIIADNGGA